VKSKRFTYNTVVGIENFRRTHMRKKALAMVLILLIATTMSLAAASTGSIGFVNYGFLDSFESGDSDAYAPGIRAEFFLSDYLGASADAIVLASDEAMENFMMMYIVSAVARLPFGFVEPFLSVGPAYLGLISENETVDGYTEGVGFNARTGVDFNILDTFSVGVEANFFVDDLEDFFANIEDYFSESALRGSLIGVSAKFKF
jgi:hypothetical protein